MVVAHVIYEYDIYIYRSTQMMTYISDYYISQDSHNTLFKNQDCHFKQLYHQLGEEVPGGV